MTHGVALMLASAALAAPGASVPAGDPPAAPAPTAQDAKATRPVVAVTDWVAADAVRLIAGEDVDVVIVPGLASIAASRTGAPTGAPSGAKPEQDASAPRLTPGDRGASPSRTAPRERQTSDVKLTDESRTAIDNAQALISTQDAKELHAAARDLCPHHAALASALRPQLRVKRADGSVEPAFWLDAALWARTVSVTRQTLSKVLPEKDRAFQDRARGLRDTLIALNDRMLLSYSELPRDAVLVVGAEGLGQIGRVHEREVRVVPSTLTTPQDQEAMREIVDLIIARRIPTIFPVDGTTNANLEELVRRVKARGGDIRIGDALHVNTPLVGDDGSPGAVERVIRHNARVVRDGFTSKGLPTSP